MSKLDQTSGWLSLLALVIGLLGSAFTAWSFIYGKAESVVTVDDLDRHNTDDKSHPSITKSVKDVEVKIDVVAKNVEESRDVQIALGARLVRMLAAEAESNKNLKAAAANYYEQEFLILVRKGASVEEAMMQALRSPWYTRPRGVGY